MTMEGEMRAKLDVIAILLERRQREDQELVNTIREISGQLADIDMARAESTDTRSGFPSPHPPPFPLPPVNS
jgi:hypothetical protein